MPGFVTHYLFGVNAFHHLSDGNLRRFIHANHGPYSLGLQGPDVFFYYMPSHLLHPSNIGDLAHSQDTGLFFRNLIASRSLFEDRPEELAVLDAYIMGFLGHYTLDCTAHPFIYAFTHYDPANPPSSKEYFGQHAYLETELDNDLLMAFKQKKPSEFHMNATIYLTAVQRRVIAAALAHTYNQTWPDYKVTEAQVRSATHWMYELTRLMRDPSGQKKVLVRSIEQRLVGSPWFSAMVPSDTYRFVTDPLNLYGRPWIHPWTKESSDATFYDLFNRAREHYLARLRSYNKLREDGFPEDGCRKFFQEYGNRSFSSGLDLDLEETL